MDFHRTFATTRSFDDAVRAICEATPAKGFRVLHVHDVQATFRDKGIEREPYKIIEVCNVKNAKLALDADPLVGLMMPCKINVFTQAGKTVVSLLRPGLLATFFPSAGLEAMIADVETSLTQIADAARD
jgi:uncharacterized protein (DUF302 family)